MKRLDRVRRSLRAGAILGMYVGDALAMPVHWYYNREALVRDTVGSRITSPRKILIRTVFCGGHPTRLSTARERFFTIRQDSGEKPRCIITSFSAPHATFKRPFQQSSIWR
jgi:hypothetical protein